MKQFFFGLVLALFTVTAAFANDEQQKVSAGVVYSDSKEVVKQVYEDAKSLSPKIEAGINSLSQSLKTTADKLWDILVRQQLVWSIVFLLLTLSALFNWWLFYKKNFGKLKEGEYILTRKQTGRSERNPDYTSYASSGTPRSEYYRFVPEGEEQVVTPIEVSKISWFKYVHLAICLTLSAFSFYHFSDMLTGFINPEYGAIRTIVETAQQLK